MELQPIRILSLGLGVQSTAIYYMASIGIFPKLDYAITSDPGKEKTKTYEYLQYLLNWQKENNGIPIIVRSDRNLYEDLLSTKKDLTRFASIPAFTKGTDGKSGMLKRQCTGEYKIEVVDNTIRDLYGLRPKQRRPLTEVWKGITLDEMERMSIPRETWKVLVYPFCGYKVSLRKGANRIHEFDDLRMSRSDLIKWYAENNLPLPPKSACVFCPYQSEHSWEQMKLQEPEDFEAACKVDDAIRDSTKQGIERPVFLHESLKPLRELKFDLTKPDMFSGECTGEECTISNP